MKNKEQIVELLMNSLSSVYCNTCNYTDEEDYCDYCHRKSMNWSIAPWFAENLADAILENKKDAETA